MQFPRPIRNLLDQAKRTSQKGKTRVVRLSATLITPVQHIPLIIPTGFERYSNFESNNSDDHRIAGHLQPGAYFNNVLKYKDNLLMEVVEREGLTQKATVYRCIPLGDSNPSQAGQHSSLANLDALNNRNVLPLEFQLMDPGYDLLRFQFADRIALMGKLDDVIHNVLTEYGEQLGLTGPNAFLGVDIERPIDNEQVFEHIIIPQGTRLVKVPEFLQKDSHYGVYSKGLGAYYRKGMWYIYTLYKLGRYKDAQKTIDFYRLPEDAIPTLESTYYVNDHNTIVLATGDGSQTDGKDIKHQNKGTGSRIINPDALAGETGSYYGRGNALTTRQDSISEFRTTERAEGNDIVPIHPDPSSNIWNPMSQNASNDGTTVIMTWQNANTALIRPGMPCRYYYCEGDVLKMKEGTVLEVKMALVPDSENTSPTFRENAKIRLFLMDAEVVQ